MTWMMGPSSPLDSVGILKRSGLRLEGDDKDGGEDEERLERPIG